jgi:Uma2 family endonuclease
MADQRNVSTVEDFESFVMLPENVERMFEYIGGEIVEVPSNPYSSKIALRISTYLGIYLLKNNLGHLTGESGGYRVSGERYAPDVGFISRRRQPEMPHEGYNPAPPDLAVEVLSPTDPEKRLRVKIANYLAAGTMVWVIYPETREIEVYLPGQPVKILDEGDVLDGGELLPGFSLAVNDIFAE